VKVRRSRVGYFCASSASSAHLYPNGWLESRELRVKCLEPAEKLAAVGFRIGHENTGTSTKNI
jgi:hypothetical protein